LVALKGRDTLIIMSQSLTKVYVHIIFSTKNHVKWLIPAIQPELFQYIGGICRNLECHPLKVGGHLDHIHILSLLSKKIALMNYIKEIKTGSSKWIKTKGPDFLKFHWQGGYGSFSVNPSQTQILEKYINEQREHHNKMTYKEEFRTLLIKYDVEFDERYIWD
jgi:putative transposase